MTCLHAASIRCLTPDDRRAFLAGLSDQEAAVLFYDWAFWARPEQLPPPGNWRWWLLRSGRGAGKTRTGAEWVIARARQGKGPIALVGKTPADVRDVMVELGDSSILQCSPPWFRPVFEPSKRRVTWPNGVAGIIYSGEEPDQLRGPQHATAWVDELAKFKHPDATMDNLEMGLRVGPDPRGIITTTPRPIPVILGLVKDPGVVDVAGISTFANAANLPPAFLERLKRKYAGTRLGRQELDGEILEDNPGALWQRGVLDALRVSNFPELVRVVVAVDPMGSTEAEEAEAGIVAAGRGRDDHLYILDDASLHASPAGWATAAIAAYNKRQADRLVAEKNFGGDMVESTIRNVEGGKFVALTLVTASRGKEIRAEPIAALYEQGRAHHVGFFPELEDELCQWTPGSRSPNRLDALVWAGTELFGGDETTLAVAEVTRR